MGVIYVPKQTVKSQKCECKTPAVNKYNGSPRMENKGPRPAKGLIWECDDCGKFWKVVDYKYTDYYNSLKSWGGRAYIPVRWYHLISLGRANRSKRKEVGL